MIPQRLLPRFWHSQSSAREQQNRLELAGEDTQSRENMDHIKPSSSRAGDSKHSYKLSAIKYGPESSFRRPSPYIWRPLSAIEMLPIELLQRIASYLLGDYPAEFPANFTTCPGFYGLMEFRGTSRTIRTKTEFTFASSFDTHILSFTDGGLLSLLEMSFYENIRSRMRSVIFVAPDLAHESRLELENPRDRRRFDVFMRLPDVQKLLPCYSFDTVLLTAALKRLRLTSVIIAPSLITTRYNRYRNSQFPRASNPHTVIFNATILSKIRLERLEMNTLDWGTYEGMKPNKTCLYQIYDRSLSHLETMTSLTLVLDDPRSKISRSPLHHASPLANFERVLYNTSLQRRTVATLETLSHMLCKCYNLKHLNLGLDKSAVDDDWPYLANARRVWKSIAKAQYPMLQTLKLSGFALGPETLTEFLDRHKRSLVSLRFNNCYLSGSWQDTLATLRTAPKLETLAMDQVSEGIQRIVWAFPFSHDLFFLGDNLAGEDDDYDYEEEEWEEDWIHVIFVGCPDVTIDLEGPSVDIDEHMNEVFDSLCVSHRTADPSELDAQSWCSEILDF